MKGIKIMQSVAEAGKNAANKQAEGLFCRAFIYQPKMPAKLLKMKK